MCYYNGQKVTHEEYIRLKHLEKLVKKYPFLNRDIEVGFNFGPTAVLKRVPGTEDAELVEMEWGFIPDPMSWPFIETGEQLNRIRHGYTDERGRFQQPLNFLNAVSEELLQKNKVYRRAALERRCLVLSTGFYEWRHVFGKNKRTGEPLKTATKYPYRVGVRNREYFWLAGIWNPWTDENTGEHIESCAIITTQANLVMEQIHNSKKRMPTMLPDELAWEWLFGDLDEKRISEIARFQIPWEELSYYTLKKDFLNSIDPLASFEYKELPPLDLPGAANREIGQMELF